MRTPIKLHRPLKSAGIAVATLIVCQLVVRADEALLSAAKAAASPARATHAPAAALSDANATYLRDVLPIVMGRCSRCHNAQSILPNWLDYKTAYGHRQEIKRRIWDSWKGQYYKQPMPAGNSGECQAITENERAMIKDWVLNGAALGVAPTDQGPRSRKERIEIGQRLFSTICAACHQPTGMGLPDKFPPLAGSDFLNADKNRAIRVLLNGRQGEIVVNGHKFNSSMPSLPLTDEDIASALSFVYNSFGNSGKIVSADEVKALRGRPDQDAPGQQKEVAHAAEEKSPFE